jgi:hypothetical protein
MPIAVENVLGIDVSRHEGSKLYDDVQGTRKGKRWINGFAANLPILR